MRQSPSFAGLRPASEAQIRAKRSNTAKGTNPELLLRRALRSLGARYRLNPRKIPGKPDLAFLGHRVVVFCDGDFWHGRDWPELEQKLAKGSNPDYWRSKIAYNVDRDGRINEELRRQGWHVVRFWETDIRERPTEIAAEIMRTLQLKARAG